MRLLLLTAVLLLAACGSPPTTPQLHPEDAIPPQLADWGLVYRDGAELHWSQDVEVYDLSTPLFTDYAHKLRTVFVPRGLTFSRDEGGRLQYPVGTIFSKTFYYPRGNTASQVRKASFTASDLQGGLKLDKFRLLETRLLVHYESGWKAFVYVWNQDQTRAERKITGALVPLQLTGAEGGAQNFTYVVPDANQCLGCHATAFNTRQAHPIGPARPDFINRSSPISGKNQLEDWMERGWLTDSPEHWARAPDWQDESEDLDARARAYLDINCAHCHSASGAADTSALWLNREPVPDQHLGLCKAPIAAGQGTGGRRWAIAPGDPDNSILVYRMASLDPGAMMPELGRSLVHEEGLALIREWIQNLDGTCKANLASSVTGH
ncbi:SO2930 family diheme c-type cytochrome [Gilvimarinus sp. F26214L]|uniref:SO2930 family diheme c-type cytochrome n=1 Tax=Gilvimarinus sp. DZF01 TaxID=3461371 RepID=UPI004045A929